jgi:hypothetical protein
MHTNSDGTIITFNFIVERMTAVEVKDLIELCLLRVETMFKSEGLRLKSRKVQIYGRGGSSFASLKRIDSEIIKSFHTNPNREVIASVSYADGEYVFSIAQFILKVETRPSHVRFPYAMLIASIVCNGGRRLDVEKIEQIWIDSASALSAFRGSFGHSLKPIMMAEIGEVVVSSGVLVSSAAVEDAGGVQYFESCGTVRARAVGANTEALFLEEQDGNGLDRWAELLSVPFRFMYENGTFPVRSLIGQ